MTSSCAAGQQHPSEEGRFPSSLERYASIVQNAVEGIFQSTPDGHYLLVNPALARMYGYDSTEELLAGVDDISRTIYVDPRVRDEFKRRMAADGEVRGLEYQVRRKDGSVIWISEHAREVRDAEGNVLYYEGFISEITRRKKAEEELLHAKEAAEAASVAKSQFLAVMSHEIRTPMNGVIGMTSLLIDTPLTAEQREFAETIRGSADALLNVINDILDFSKIEAGRIDLEEAEFAVRGCLEGALDVLAPKATEKGLDLLYEVADSVPTLVSGDSARLRQVLINLLGNAVKFTHVGEVVLSVTAEAAEPEGGVPCTRLVCEVRDTGIGIAPEAMGRLFQSFSQVDASTTRRFGGTGLGLAISRRLVELMGGTVEVESELGVGSVFRFSVVLRVRPGRPMPYALAPRAALSGKRVLIVDDNSTNRRILGAIAQKQGMLPVLLGSGGEALALLERGERFDCAVLDMQMPGMDGVMLARQIRLLPATAALPMVLLSSLGQREARAVDGLFAASLTKPVKTEQLLDVLVRVAHRRPSPEVAGAGVRRGERPPGGGRPERVLVAEDNLVNQRVALLMFQHLGFCADVVSDGRAALDAVLHGHYDIVFLDVQMPEMDGLEVVRRLRAEMSPGRRRPWVIALTANALAEDRERCLAAGMDDYVSKPIRAIELAAAVDRAVARISRGLPPVVG